ncbi:Coiled-coil domain-containing protein 17 [Phytophthora pseudosyringae]|uniref:Coiled-coil domain-containing protein 17 n=1 Tax=Phytophthora pseudosyringae TaxID=221518 RepID=A0A8T1W0B9_9STRA|nr:Coiled-coil domain-containing protein 17 [Phytophthora pseudosyringae]
MSEMVEEEAEVETLLKQIASAKQKELRLRAEKKRIRVELGQLQAGTLWSREEQTHKQLLEVRRAKEQLETQRKTEEEKFAKLSDNLKEQELQFRKGANAKSSPFQQVAASVVATTTHPTETSNQKENGSVLTQVPNVVVPDKLKLLANASPPVMSTSDARALVGNREMSTQDDALQHLVRNLNCDEQQKRIVRLQAELEKANSRRQEISFDIPAAKVARHAGITYSDDIPNSSIYQDHGYTADSLEPGSNTHDSRHTAAVRKSANKIIRLKPLDGSHQPSPRCADASPTSTHPAENAPVAPLTQPALPTAPSSLYPPQYAIPGYPQSYPVPTAPIAPYPLFSSPIMPINPYGIGFPSAYFPGCPYPAAPPWFPPSASYPYQAGNIPPPERPAKPALTQQEADIRRLERELEMNRIANEQQAEAKEFSQLQSRLQELQIKVSTLTAADNSSSASNDEAMADDKDDSALKSLKKKHLESLAKVRNERDLLEEQEKLEEFKERIQRRREEKKREFDHEDWIAKQKRELVALRLQRAIQHNDVKTDGLRTDIPGGSTDPYNPESGFVLFWDFATGIPATANDLQITYAVFGGNVIRTPFKVVSAKEFKATGPQHKLCLFLSSRHIKSLPAASDLRVIIEVVSMAQNGATSMSLGWTAFDIFKSSSEGELVFKCGFFKLPMKQSSMPDPSKTLVLPPTTGECGDVRIHIRLVHGERVDEGSQMLVDPELHAARYQLPDKEKVSPRPQSNGTMTRRPSIQGRRTPNERPTPAKAYEDPNTTPPTTTTERLSVPPPPARPQKQDFLDVERSRLLSSASSRPPSTRPRSNIPLTGDRTRLPPFREDSDAEADGPWIRVDKSLELQRRLLSGSPFQSGDGFNVCIDGGRGFPDSVTISKVTIAALHADRTQVAAENGSTFAAVVSDVFDPVFDAYVEYRQHNFNPTLTLVIRVDTIELVSKRPVILGYTVFPVFLDVDTRGQPNRPSIPQFILNEGGFQLPLHAQIQSAEASQPLSAKSCEEFPRIPCATVLLRIARAKSGDGLALLSRKDIPPNEWEAKGLLVPAPQYCDQFYDSLCSVPSGIEEIVYSIRHKSRRPKTVAQSLQQMSLTISEARDVLKTKPTSYLDLSSALRYEPAIGFRVAVDALHNVKAKGVPFFKVLFSVYPPGSFYQAIRLTGDVYFTTTMDWTSSQTSPEFGDGYMTLRNSPSDQLLVVLFDVRSLTRHPKTGAITSQQYGWTFLPVLAHSRSVNTCAVQLPIFRGEVNLGILKTAIGGLSALVDDIRSDKMKQLLPVAEDGASLFVRLQDPQLPHLPPQAIIDASLSKMVPPRLSAKYAYDSTKLAALKKKTPISKLLPASVPDKQFEKELNQAFAQVFICLPLS